MTVDSFRKKQQNRTLEIPECGSVYIVAAKVYIFFDAVAKTLIRPMFFCSMSHCWLATSQMRYKVMTFLFNSKSFHYFFSSMTKICAIASSLALFFSTLFSNFATYRFSNEKAWKSRFISTVPSS